MNPCKEYSETNCTKCAKGYMLNFDNSCTICPGNTFSSDGVECIEIENCVNGTAGSQIPNCTQCVDGYSENGLAFSLITVLKEEKKDQWNQIAQGVKLVFISQRPKSVTVALEIHFHLMV